MVFRTGDGYVEQTALLFQRPGRVARHTARKQVFFHAHHKDIFKLQPLGGVHGHQRYLFVVSVLVRILVGKQGHFRKEITQRGIGIPLLQPLCTEVAHTVCKLFDILLAAEVLGRVVLADISDNTRLTDYLRTKLVGVLFGNALDKSGYQTAKILQLARRSFIDVHPVGQRFAEHGPQAYIVAGGGSRDFIYGSVAYPACRVVDDTLEGFFIIRIDREAEVGDYIFYFLALIERQPAVNAIRHAALAHGFLKDTALRVGAIEYGKIGIGVIPLPAQFGYLVDYNIALLHIAVCLIHSDGLSLIFLRKDFLANLPLVLLYQAVGGRNDGLGGAVVLFQLKDLRTRIYLCEIQDIVDVGSPEGVDALRVIAHHTDVLMLFCQLKHNAVLGKVSVLVLVHQDIAELRPVACKHLRTVAEKQKGIEQQIVEIHGIRLPATLPVAAVNIAYGRHLGRTIAFVGFFVVGIARRRHEVVLGIGDTCLHRTRFIHFLVQSHLLDD